MSTAPRVPRLFLVKQVAERLTNPCPVRRIAGIVRISRVAWLLPALIVACATPRGPVSAPAALLQEDPFDAKYKVQCDAASGKTVCVMTGNALRPFTPRYPLLSLGVVSEAAASGPSRYFLRMVYIGERQWLNVGAGSTLSLTIDGESLAVPGAGSRGNRYTGEADKVYEVVLYETSAALIRKIAAAKNVVVGVKGDFPLEKSFGSFNHLYFRQFVQHYIDRAPAPPK